MLEKMGWYITKRCHVKKSLKFTPYYNPPGIPKKATKCQDCLTISTDITPILYLALTSLFSDIVFLLKYSFLLNNLFSMIFNQLTNKMF